MLRRRDLLLGLTGLATLVAAPATAQTWRTYRNARFGTTIEHPDTFRPGRPPQNGAGLGFTAADTAAFSVWGSHNSLDHDLAGLEKFIRDETTPGKRITYDARGRNWFVLAGIHGDNTFYERYLLSHGGKIVNGFTMQYPTRLKAPYDPLVTRMSKSFRAGRGEDTEGNP
ncbi:MAG: hypothetical protein ACRECO_06215 [Xanthobacteraceae bacterium]